MGGGHTLAKIPGCECGQVWTSRRDCHCRRCHRHFGSLEAFDRHLKGNTHVDPKGFTLSKDRFNNDIWIGVYGLKIKDMAV